MAGRARIATAACLMASGLLVAGSSAALAFANPEDPGAGGSTDSTSGNTPGASTGHSFGSLFPGLKLPAAGTTGATTGSTGVSGLPTKPRFTIGNGRTGLGLPTTGETAVVPGAEPPSKQPEAGSGSTDPTSQPDSGKPVESKPAEGDPAEGTPAGGTTEDGATEGEGTGKVTDNVTGGTGPSSSGTPGTPPAATPGLESATPDLQAMFPGVLDLAAREGGQPTAAALLAGEEAEEPLAAPWPWSWWNWTLPGTAPGVDGGGNGSPPTAPIFSFPETPPMLSPLLDIPRQLIYEINGIAQPLISAVTGLATAAAQLPFTPVTLPVVIPPGAGVEAPVGNGGGAGGVTAPAVPRINPPEVSKPELAPAPPEKVTSPPPATRQVSPPASPASNDLLPAPTYRMGYVDYLRAAGIGEVAAVAVPGVTGILVLTSAGGLIGYRQARAGRAVRAGGPARFMG